MATLQLLHNRLADDKTVSGPHKDIDKSSHYPILESLRSGLAGLTESYQESLQATTNCTIIFEISEELNALGRTRGEKCTLWWLKPLLRWPVCHSSQRVMDINRAHWSEIGQNILTTDPELFQKLAIRTLLELVRRAQQMEWHPAWKPVLHTTTNSKCEPVMYLSLIHI